MSGTGSGGGCTDITDDEIGSVNSSGPVGQHLILNVMCWKIKQVQIVLHGVAGMESVAGADYT